MPDELPRMLTPRELSDYLQIPVRTIEGWRSAGTGPPFVRMGKHVRYGVPDLLQWLRDGRGARHAE